MTSPFDTPTDLPRAPTIFVTGRIYRIVEGTDAELRHQPSGDPERALEGVMRAISSNPYVVHDKRARRPRGADVGGEVDVYQVRPVGGKVGQQGVEALEVPALRGRARGVPRLTKGGGSA